MTLILVEDDAVLRTVPVILDSAAEAARAQAVAEFYRHDVPGRDNGIADMEEMYGKIWRAIVSP